MASGSWCSQDNRRVRIPCSVALPAGRERARLVRLRQAPLPLRRTRVRSLAEQPLLYSQIVWRQRGAPTNSSFSSVPDRIEVSGLLDVLEPAPVGRARQLRRLSIVERRRSGRALEASGWRSTAAKTCPRRRSSQLVPLPTDGVFAEAVLGRFELWPRSST